MVFTVKGQVCCAFLVALISSIVPKCLSFPSLSFLSTPAHRNEGGLKMASWDDSLRELKSIQERQTQNALIDALFLNDGDASSSVSSLLALQLAGQARLPVVTNRTKVASAAKRTSLVLTQENISSDNLQTASALFLPLESQAQLKLLSFAVARRPLSKSVLLGLNTLLVNRDGALFDNLPWSEWTIDPKKMNRDAAGNPIESKFHLGKRDAYNRFLGKDWKGRSLAIGDMALRLKYMMEKDTKLSETDEDRNSISSIDQEESQKSLSIRIVQLQIRELQMELADTESELAIARTNGGDSSPQDLEAQKTVLLEKIAAAKEDLATVTEESGAESSRLGKVLDRVADWTTDNSKNAPPYRGALSYAPILDPNQDIGDNILPYTSPYDLLKDILEDQLNAKVIGCVLENTSLLEGNLALGGAVILQRITPTKTAEIAGEVVEYNDEDENFGNEGVTAGETIIVECDSDEAIGLAVAYGAPLKVDSEIFERASMLAEPQQADLTDNSIDYLTMWRTKDPEMNFQVEGEAEMSSRSNPISIPRTTSSLFDEIFEDKPTASSMYPTDNPIKSLGELDALNNEQKAKTLLEMSNFSGQLPRPRLVRNSESNPLDELLLPLIDESVRRQYLIRDAEKKGDLDRAAELKSQQSQRQAAKERAQAAYENGIEDEWERWEGEADFLESLRADITQDEGSYNRFLDRDYWYEKDRQGTANRVDRSKFGNLLDGIE